MNNGEPVIRPIPTVEKFLEMVDTVITPQTPDEEIKSFIDIVLTVANIEDNHVWGLATSGVRRAFTHTSAFEEAFREFAGHPERPGYSADHYMIHAGETSQ